MTRVIPLVFKNKLAAEAAETCNQRHFCSKHVAKCHVETDMDKCAEAAGTHGAAAGKQHMTC